MYLLCPQWYALALLPFAFALHPSLLSIDRPTIDQSSWPNDTSGSSPLSPIDGRANRSLTLSFTIKKVID